jgi:hypothetical protein
VLQARCCTGHCGVPNGCLSVGKGVPAPVAPLCWPAASPQRRRACPQHDTLHSVALQLLIQAVPLHSVCSCLHRRELPPVVAWSSVYPKRTALSAAAGPACPTCLAPRCGQQTQHLNSQTRGPAASTCIGASAAILEGAAQITVSPRAAPCGFTSAHAKRPCWSGCSACSHTGGRSSSPETVSAGEHTSRMCKAGEMMSSVPALWAACDMQPHHAPQQNTTFNQNLQWVSRPTTGWATLTSPTPPCTPPGERLASHTARRGRMNGSPGFTFCSLPGD